MSDPEALAFDSSGNLYVVSEAGTVSEFAPGNTVPIATYSSGLDQPDALVFDLFGNLYVANQSGNVGVSKFSITPTAGGVTIQSSVESRPMLIGGTNSSPVAGINLTSAELARIVTTANGTVTIGDTAQTGNITFSTATPATAVGAALNVLQSTSGAGQIILDSASGSGTVLNGNGGTVTLMPGTGSIQTTLYATGTLLATNGFSASGKSINLALGVAPTLGTQFTVVNNTATPAASNLISGTFSDLSQEGTYATSYLGTPYYFQANYQGGDGNDLVLTNVAGPVTQLIVTSQSPATVTADSGFGFTVTAEDTQGNVATSFAGSVTVALANNPGNSTLGGTLTVTAVGGVAVFSGLTLNKVGGGYTLAVTSGTLTSATSSGISVAPGTAMQLLISGEPPSTTVAGSSFGLTVTAEDAGGNVLSGFNGFVTVALANNPYSSTLEGSSVVGASNGLASFSGLTLNNPGSGYALQVTSGTLTSATSSAFSVTPAAATFIDNSPSLSITLNTNAQVAISTTGTSYQFTLVSGLWGGTNDANLTGSGSSTLTVTSAGISAFTSSIQISDAGGSGGNSVIFADSGTAAYLNDFDLSLSKTSDNLAFNGSSAFTGVNGIYADLPGSITIGPGSLTTVNGSLTLNSLGTNSTLSIGGNVLSQSGSLDLGATGNVTVDEGVMINSGAGSLTLSADANGYGAVADGIGTLSIAPGATVISANSSTSSITLSGANISIDTSNNPATIEQQAPVGVTYDAALSDPDALVVDSSGNLYVANYGNDTVSKLRREPVRRASRTPPAYPILMLWPST